MSMEIICIHNKLSNYAINFYITKIFKDPRKSRFHNFLKNIQQSHTALVFFSFSSFSANFLIFSLSSWTKLSISRQPTRFKFTNSLNGIEHEPPYFQFFERVFYFHVDMEGILNVDYRKKFTNFVVLLFFKSFLRLVYFTPASIDFGWKKSNIEVKAKLACCCVGRTPKLSSNDQLYSVGWHPQ